MVGGFNILKDDLSGFVGRGPAFVTFGETMVRDTPADRERPERTRQVWISMAGSELTLAVAVSRLGIPSSYIIRVPDNPYGWMLRDLAREQGLDTSHFVWADRAEPIGRFMYELGRTPRRGAVWYQRMYSAASRLDAGMVDWQAALQDARLFHTSGITFGLALHSRYHRNHNYRAFKEALAHKPADCLVGLDFNYRSTLWSFEQARDTLDAILIDDIDVLITSIYDMARFYGIGCGQYSAQHIVSGDVDQLRDDEIAAFGQQVHARFGTKIVATTQRYPDSLERLSAPSIF